MFGRKKRDRWEEDGFPEEESLTDGTGIYSGITDDDADAGNPYPDEEIYGDDGYGPEYGTDDPAGESWADEEDEEEPEEKPETRSIFRPDVRKPNFVISVQVNTIRVLVFGQFQDHGTCQSGERAGLSGDRQYSPAPGPAPPTPTPS